jgi:hypothetical protein
MRRPHAPEDSLREELTQLKRKYELMLSLRCAHIRAATEPTFVEPDPRPTMRMLAERWPGALRELDQLSIETLTSRIAAIQRVADAGTPIEVWMHGILLFHKHMRASLALRVQVEPRASRPARSASSRVEEVIHHVAVDLGIEADEVRALLVFRRPSRTRARRAGAAGT